MSGFDWPVKRLLAYF